MLGEGCVDVYNSKVLRSTQGSIFHTNCKGNLEEWVDKLKENNVPVYGTALENGVPYGEVTPAGSFALIVGNEGNGVRQEILAKRMKLVYSDLRRGRIIKCCGCRDFNVLFAKPGCEQIKLYNKLVHYIKS